MIFVTTGTQLPFPRLQRIISEAAPNIDEQFIAQIGEYSEALPNVEFVETLAPDRYIEILVNCRCVVGHAGIGTFLAARRFEKPLFILPRLASLREHRNDHQAATARQLATVIGVSVFSDANDLLELLQRTNLPPVQNSVSPSLKRLRGALREEIFSDHK